MPLPSNGLEAYVIGAIVIVFNMGGIFYLARNHFAHVNKKLDAYDARLRRVERGVARIEGKLAK